MTNALEGLPADVAVLENDPAAAQLTVDAAVYPLEAVYGAAYIFIDRCYVLLDRATDAAGAQRFRITLAAKKPPVERDALRALVGEFVNELLSCAWRYQIAQENRGLIEQVTAAALGGAMGSPSLDELESFDFSEEPFEDPLGIAQSWEDKYKKKDKPAAEGAAKSDAAGQPAAKSDEGGEA